VAYLVFLGINLWRSEPAQSGADRAAVAPRRWLSDMASGFAVALGNPKAVLFYGALLPTVIDLPRVTHGDLVWLVLVDMAVLILVNNSYGLAASRARGLFVSRRAMKALNRGAGGVMIGAGVLAASR
jgi:threonine/homoserine/homoserine lactone efflux protein